MSRTRKPYARLLCGVAISALIASAGVARAEDPLDIAAQPLATALKEFGMKTGQPVLYGPALADNKRELLTEKVMLETAIAKGRLLVDLGEIQAKAESVAAGLASP